MTTYRQNITTIDNPQLPQLGPLVGGKIAKRSRVTGVFRGQSKTLALGRRVVAAQSIAGDSAWMVPDTTPVSGSNTHPTPTSNRPVAYARFDLSPGHLLRCSTLYIPAGQTQVDIGATYAAGGAGGAARVDATWTDQAASSESTFKTIALDGSGLANGAAPDGEAAWASVRVATDNVTPSEFLANADVARWSEHAGVELELAHQAGARVLDLCVSEIPIAFARDSADDADQMVSGLYGDPTPDSPGPSVTHPVERIASDDPRGGTLHTLAVPQAQRVRLGPMLVSWTSYVESDVTPLTTTLTPKSGTSAGFRRLWDEASVSYDADEPGWSLSCGAYARAYAENHPYAMEAVGTIPVLVSVYAAVGSTPGNQGTVRVQVNAWSWIDVVITEDVAWRHAYGHLRVGKGPGDPSICQAFIRVDAGSDPIDVYALMIHAAGQYAPAGI